MAEDDLARQQPDAQGEATTATVPRPQQGPSARMVGGVPSPVRGPIAEAGQMAQLLGKVVYSAVRHPRGYWGEVRDEMYDLLKLCWLPTVLTIAGFGFLLGTLAVNILLLIGAPNRLGSYFLLASIREFSPFLNAMVIAGVIGAAITADLGARRIREELDAMRVLGLDPVRQLVLPRIIATTLMTAVMDVLAIIIGVLVAVPAVVGFGGTSAAAYFGNLLTNLTSIELVGTLLKSAIFGLLIGVVCAHKGLTAKGGAVGVGRAVNEAVVIAFVGIWVVDFVFSAVMLGFFPEILVTR